MTITEISSKIPFNNADGKRFEEIGSGSFNILNYMVRTSEELPTYWSPARDRALRNFVIKSPHLSGAFYNMIAKMTAIPFRIVPRDPSVKAHMRLAEQYERALRENSGIKLGWNDQYERFISDHLNTDNGSFFHIIGDGRLDEPLIGMPLGVIHLDSVNCSRTSSYEFPVVYHDPVTGKRYKLHTTRVMYKAQMPSPIYRMYGVGLCAASRCFVYAKSLLDVENYKAEKMGSRPARKMLVGSKISSEQIAEAFAMAELEMDNAGLKHYSKIVAIGNANDDVDVKPVDLTSAPEGFTEEESTQLGMYLIAMALGIDARELWPATASGATKADALLSHMKSRGKGPGQIIRVVEDMFEQKYLPSVLRFEFDYQDDEQDKLKADIQEQLSLSRQKNLKSGVTNNRIERQMMVKNNVLTQEQYEELELSDGRLVGGESVLLLFNSEDTEMQLMLDIGIQNPLAYSSNDPDAIIKAIENHITDVYFVAHNAGLVNQRKKALQAIAALNNLKETYESRKQADMLQAQAAMPNPDAAPSQPENQSNQPTPPANQEGAMNGQLR